MPLLLVVACGTPKRGNSGDDDGSADGGSSCPADCPDGTTCSNGQCKTPCEAADDNPSNLGCDFWAADLDNESSNFGASTTPRRSSSRSSPRTTTTSPVDVTVTQERRARRPAGRPSDRRAGRRAAAHRDRASICRSARSTARCGQNGTYMPNSGSGTFVSPHAYHVVVDGPVVVYQFNPIIQQFSNDASTLIPIQALGADYVVVGYPTANPCGITGVPIDGIPDHTAVTIIPIEDDTHVTVTPTHPITRVGRRQRHRDRRRSPKGGTLDAHAVALHGREPRVGSVRRRRSLDCISTARMATSPARRSTPTSRSWCSRRTSAASASAARRTSSTRRTGTSSRRDDICCTDHLEEQLLPVTALGKRVRDRAQPDPLDRSDRLGRARHHPRRRHRRRHGRDDEPAGAVRPRSRSTRASRRRSPRRPASRSRAISPIEVARTWCRSTS